MSGPVTGPVIQPQLWRLSLTPVCLHNYRLPVNHWASVPFCSRRLRRWILSANEEVWIHPELTQIPHSKLILARLLLFQVSTSSLLVQLQTQKRFDYQVVAARFKGSWCSRQTRQWFSYESQHLGYRKNHFLNSFWRTCSHYITQMRYIKQRCSTLHVPSNCTFGSDFSHFLVSFQRFYLHIFPLCSKVLEK